MAVDSATYQTNPINYMGFATREGGKYFTIYDGKFSVRVPKGTPGSHDRINKEGREVSEIYHDSFTGRLVNIRTRESGQYGKSWEFDFKDSGEVYTLQLSYSNSYATNILKMLPNVDLNKEMKLQPAQKLVEGKKKSSLFISQDGVTLKHAYTKETPNGLPQMEQKTVKGQTVWDDTDRLIFLEAMVKRDILPKLSKEGVAVATPLNLDETPAGAQAAAEADDF